METSGDELSKQGSTSNVPSSLHFGPSRLRINRFTARFYDPQVERLFGSYSYRNRLQSVRHGTAIFGFFVLLYMVAETWMIGKEILAIFRLIQFVGIAIVCFFVFREFRMLKANVSKEGIPENQSISLDSINVAWARAFSSQAGKIMDCISIYCCLWGWITLIPIRVILGNWDEMPVSLIIFSWGAPVVARCPFVYSLLSHIVGIGSFALVSIFHSSFTNVCLQVSALSSASIAGVFLSYSTSIYQRSQLRAILWYYGATPQGTSIFEFMRVEYARLKGNLRGSVRFFRFKNPDWETRFVDFLHVRSEFFVRITLLGMCFSNAILYIPDNQLNSDVRNFAFSIRTYAMFPLWVLCLILSMYEKLAPYRHWLVTFFSCMAICLEYSVIAFMNKDEIDPYFIMMWRIVDVSCTSLCLPFVNVAFVIIVAFFGTIAMVIAQNHYFYNLLNMTLYISSLAVGLYLSKLTQDDSRMAFIQFAHRIKVGDDGIYGIAELPFPRPSMIPDMQAFAQVQAQYTEDIEMNAYSSHTDDAVDCRDTKPHSESLGADSTVSQFEVPQSFRVNQ